MIEKDVAIVNRLGLHARAAAKLVHLAGGFRSQIRLSLEGQSVDAKSILGILMLGAAQGMTVSIRCEGEDEGEALVAIEELFACRFEESS
ncbi:MAG: HPr family phosphocarrier protein [Deltaproteobacteria bacterium]|nr:HPr family phosphocarrier protein [Deltaproteobacteria bacterium]